MAWWIVNSPWGRAFLALRENPVRALSLGVDTRRYTLMAFAIGSALGGVSGVRSMRRWSEFVDPVALCARRISLNLLLMVIVGGSGFLLSGRFSVRLIAVLLPEWLRFTQGWYLIIYAVMVVMLLLAWSPTGILGIASIQIPGRAQAPGRASA